MVERLALYGGKPVREKPLPPMFPGALFIGEEEKKEILEVIESKSLFRFYGPKLLNKTKTFEEKFSQYIGVKHALGVTSGTAALITSLASAGVGPGDEVIIPAYCWIMDPMAVMFVRAIPVIAEINKTLTLDPRDVENKITDRTKAIIAVHMRGFQCDMDALLKIAEKHDLILIEDVAQACGGMYKGAKLGSIGHLGAFSFQLNKVITAGEGGAVTTDDDDMYKRAAVFHDAPFYVRFGIDPYPGINFRMSELTSAVLLAQLQKIDKIIEKMRENKKRLLRGLSKIDGIELHTPVDPEGEVGLAVILFFDSFGKARFFAKALNAENVGAVHLFDPEKKDLHVYYHWDVLMRKLTLTHEGCPFTCPYYGKRIVYSRDMCPRSLEILGRAVNIDVNPLLSEEDIDSIIEAVEKVMSVIESGQHKL